MWIKDIRDYIIYEDKDILVCHKPAGIAVQNARVGSMDLESLLKNYVAQKVPGKMPYLGIIHRLDQPVEGVLVFALNSRAGVEQTDDIRKNKEDLPGGNGGRSKSTESNSGGLDEERQ